MRRHHPAGAALVLVLLLVLGAFFPRSGAAQSVSAEPQFATLVADTLYIDGPRILVAEGNVEALFGTVRLRATRITYDRGSEQIRIEGPLVLYDGSDILILADQAELSQDLQRGLIRSARVVFDEQLQIAAGSVERLGPRFTEMTNVVASSCEICAERPTPLWEIRARRVVHDDEAQLVYFEGAQFRLFGLPVVYIPRLRVPDPRLDRATGFLSPRFTVNTGHGVGLRTPYFIVLGTSRDLTLTPFVATRGTRALELRYRQAFAAGMLELGGLVARDDIRPESTRAMGYAEGQFALGRGYELRFNVVQPSDRQLLDDYGRAVARLTSDITVEQVRRDSLVRLQLLKFRSLRLGDVNKRLPNLVGQAVMERRYEVPGVGGVATMRLEAHAHRRREAQVAFLPPPYPGAGPGPRPQSVGRVSLDLDWRRDAVLPGGVLGAAGLHLGLDQFRLSETGGVFPTSVRRVTPAAMVELRWPLVRAVPESGAVHVIEPVAQVIWGRNRVSALPQDLARMPELDEGNLFTYDRFPGRDAREAGLRANLGVSWTRHDPEGWSSRLVLGRVWRARDLGQFADETPLAGRASHWLVAASFDMVEGLSLSNRALITSDLRLERTAFEMDWTAERYAISTSYMRILSNPFEDRANTASEWSFDGQRQIDELWTARVGWRYDIARKRAARANLGLTYENECLRMEMGLERQFTSATTSRARTSFGLNIDILGVGGNPSRARRSCST